MTNIKQKTLAQVYKEIESGELALNTGDTIEALGFYNEGNGGSANAKA